MPVERPNGKFACIFDKTLLKLDWELLSIEDSEFQLKTNNGTYFINYKINDGILANVIKTDVHSLIFNINSTDPGYFSTVIPSGLIDPVGIGYFDPDVFILIDDLGIRG